MGAIGNRSKEHLGYSDETIIALPKMLLNALDDLIECRDPVCLIYDEQLNDFFEAALVQGGFAGGTDWHKVIGGGMNPHDV